MMWQALVIWPLQLTSTPNKSYVVSQSLIAIWCYGSSNLQLQFLTNTTCSGRFYVVFKPSMMVSY